MQYFALPRASTSGLSCPRSAELRPDDSSRWLTQSPNVWHRWRPNIYLDDVLVVAPNPNPNPNLKTIRALVERLRMYNVILSFSKARSVAADTKLFIHSIAPSAVRRNTETGYVWMEILMPKTLKHARALMRGVGDCREFLHDPSKRIRPFTALLREGVR